MPRAPLGRRVLIALADIKLAHSVFALPFAIVAAVMVAPQREFIFGPGGQLPNPVSGRAFQFIDWRIFGGQIALIVGCMFFARTWAMLVNRTADAQFDAENERTARRAIASGRLTTRDGWMMALASGTCFMTCCALFWVLYGNHWPMILGVPTLLWIGLYSFTKRFTALSHLFLGGALAVSPIAAVIGVNPDAFFTYTFIGGAESSGVTIDGLSAEGTAVLLLSGFVLLWVGGFDVIYALQDVVFDVSRGLRSIPARLGGRRAVWVSRAMHVLAFVLLVLAWRADGRFGWITGVGVAAVGVLLIVEHIVLARRGLAGLPMAFFTCNGVVSLVFGTAAVMGLLLRETGS